MDFDKLTQTEIKMLKQFESPAPLTGKETEKEVDAFDHLIENQFIQAHNPCVKYRDGIIDLGYSEKWVITRKGELALQEAHKDGKKAKRRQWWQEHWIALASLLVVLIPALFKFLKELICLLQN